MAGVKLRLSLAPSLPRFESEEVYHSKVGIFHQFEVRKEDVDVGPSKAARFGSTNGTKLAW